MSAQDRATYIFFLILTIIAFFGLVTTMYGGVSYGLMSAVAVFLWTGIGGTVLLIRRHLKKRGKRARRDSPFSHAIYRAI